jgi:hypothetical protein
VRVREREARKTDTRFDNLSNFSGAEDEPQAYSAVHAGRDSNSKVRYSSFLYIDELESLHPVRFERTRRSSHFGIRVTI